MAAPPSRGFHAQHPNIRFNVNGEGDVPRRMGAADLLIDHDPHGRASDGEVLYHEIFLSIGSPETARRISDLYYGKADDDIARYLPVGKPGRPDRIWRHLKCGSLEGFPLLHVKLRTDAPAPHLAGLA